MKGWSTFEHGADIGILGRGRRLEEAFENGAKAMFSIMVEDIDSIRPLREVQVTASSYDLPGLFVAWLNELLAQKDITGVFFSRFKVEIQEMEFRLRGHALGEPLDPSRHTPGVEVKGATFTELRVEKRGSDWEAACVVDV